MKKISQNTKSRIQIAHIVHNSNFKLPFQCQYSTIPEWKCKNPSMTGLLYYYTCSNNDTIYSCITSHDVLIVQECVAQSSYVIWFCSLFYCIIFYLMLCLTIIVIVSFVWLCVYDWLYLLSALLLIIRFFSCTVYVRYV